MTTYQVTIAVDQDQHERIALLASCQLQNLSFVRRPSYLATGLLLVLFTTLFNLFVITFQRAVVFEKSTKPFQDLLQIVMVALVFTRERRKIVV